MMDMSIPRTVDVAAGFKEVGRQYKGLRDETALQVEEARQAAQTAATKAAAAQLATGKTPMEFGAIGDGVADDTAAINAAIAAGVSINGAGRTYRVTNTIVLPSRRHRWRDITIDGTGITTNGLFTTAVAELICDAPLVIGNLTGAIGSNSKQVVLNTAAGLAVDDWVLLRSQKKMAETEVSGETARHSRACELLRVRSIDGNTVAFWSRTQDGYDPADGATLSRVQTTTGVDFDRVTFIGADTGFRIHDGFESRYRNVQCINQTTRGVDEDRCVRTDGDDWHFSSEATQPVFTQAPYGLSYVACQDCHYGDVSGHRTRHLTTTGSNSASRGRSVSRGCTLGDIHATDCFAAPVDQHPGGGFIQVGDVYATYAEGASQYAATQFQGAGGSVKSINANNGMGVLFDSYGFNQVNFLPLVSVGTLISRSSDYAFSASNYSNRYGTGTAQRIAFNIGHIDAYCGIGLTLNPQSEDIEGGVQGGQITALLSLGVGRCVYATVTGTNVARVQMGPVDCKAQGTARIVQMDGGKIGFSGGRLTGISGTAEIRLTNATMRLIGTEETNLTETLASGGAILRATMA